jgi:D-arabinose 1-dehydrogenase-like Zn-dependent alcohol dehydrogenase
VNAFRPGDRVISVFHPRWFGGRPPLTATADTYGSGQDGWLAEYKAVSQEAVVRLPDGPSYEEGSTLPCAGVTAWNALSGPDPVRAGSTVLTLGNWRNQVRLARAITLLAEGLPIAKVARRLCYSSPSAFTAMMRRTLSLTPREVVSCMSARSTNDQFRDVRSV